MHKVGHNISNVEQGHKIQIRVESFPLVFQTKDNLREIVIITTGKNEEDRIT